MPGLYYYCTNWSLSLYLLVQIVGEGFHALTFVFIVFSGGHRGLTFGSVGDNRLPPAIIAPPLQCILKIHLPDKSKFIGLNNKFKLTQKKRPPNCQIFGLTFGGSIHFANCFLLCITHFQKPKEFRLPEHIHSAHDTLRWFFDMCIWEYSRFSVRLLIHCN